MSIVLILASTQMACQSSPKVGLLFSKYCIKQIPIPPEGYFAFYYKKTNPNIIFISEKTEMGPGIMLDLATGQQDYRENPCPHPENISHSFIPGETKEEWMKRTASPPRIADKTFAGIGPMTKDPSFAASQGYSLKYLGKSVRISRVATKGFPFPTGLRETEDYLFTGNLIISIRGEVVIRQHLENFPSFPLSMRAHEALKVGLLIYKDEHPDGSGTLYILQIKPWKREETQEPEQGKVIMGEVGPGQPKQKQH